MKSIAFIFSNSPYGNSISKEGLDVVLSCSLTTKKIALFFIDDGVLQLFLNQKPEYINSYNYSLSFKILSLYDIKDFFFCKYSAYKRGLKENDNFLLPVKFLNNICLRRKINSFDYILKW
ncbi:sulfurtransferase complex subunit TusC [Buchnera aphidicola]|uniref:Uncharacterized conserved protein n=2 Tax=Buchnera aphidicola (Cinara cedri) TaxID=261318 RepID=Q056Z7_BUCCC|nr:sulfurtransferase complex subunit TusC [Buchnera aphidicola]AAW72714.1 conserved hypothetical protein [Buchnera aphidicola (Cinara cedri)]ABJ90802.1 uncharacterized conserved protein [Buchnera aphidicola BCc]